jgi:cytoskeletal protein RodZ
MATIHAVHPAGGWPQTDPESSGRTGFGEWLRRVREARGLTLDDVCRETKIPLRNLEALEHGQLGTIPVFYERAEVRAIARAVGVDERLAVGRLDSAIAPAAEPARRSTPRAELNLGRPLVVLGLACAAVLAASVVGRAIFDQFAAEVTSAPARSDASVSQPREPETVAPTSRPASAGNAAAVAAPAAAAAAAEDATPAVERVSEIVIRTEPPGAHVTVNGIGWGVSPVTIRHLSPGNKRIRATKEGFAAAERTLTLDDDGRQTLALRLTAVN